MDKNLNKYRIIKQYEKPELYNSPDDSVKKLGVFLDLELTGLDYPEEKITEIAMVKFEYNDEGKIFRLIDEFQSYQDPHKPISKFITTITGITNDTVKDKSIDKIEVNNFLENVDLIIAFNSIVDRNFFESEFPDIEIKSWGCLYRDIKWREEGMSCLKLECLALQFNFYFDAHRAKNDCLAGIEILTQILTKSGELVLKRIIKNSEKPFYNFYVGDADNIKDILTNQSYDFPRYNPMNSWIKEVCIEDIEEEVEFLRKNIPPIDKSNIIIRPLDSYNRFLYQYRPVLNQAKYHKIII